MEYESVQQTAERLRVTVRTVQKWAKEGKLPGAKQLGRAWLIPAGINAPKVQDISPVTPTDAPHMFLPLMRGSFSLGHAMEYIQGIHDPDERTLAMAEHSYFTGHPRVAAETASLYLDHEDPSLALSAGIIYSFSYMYLGYNHISEHALKKLNTLIDTTLSNPARPELYHYAVLAAKASSLALHTLDAELPLLKDVLHFLPGGLRLYGAYLVAFAVFQKKDYSRALGMIEMALAYPINVYPVASIHLMVLRVICQMHLKQPKEARKTLEIVWGAAMKDGFIQPFAKHHNMLLGLLENALKKENSEAYQAVMALTTAHNTNMPRMHNMRTGRDVAFNLTNTELSIATLFRHGWAIKEIAGHMDLSERMIKHHLSIVYEKLNISSREELGQYML